MNFKKDRSISRRKFLKKSVISAVSMFSMPYINPGLLQGNTAPSNRINIGCIGVGRMGRGDLKDIIQYDDVQIVAVCDVDSWRLNNAKQQVENYYLTQQKSGRYTGCMVYNDYRDLLLRDDIDAVMIATPDHWHTLPALQAAKSGKDIFIQKPLTLTIPEGRILSDMVHRYGRILQVGSQQRSDFRFRHAAELVRNGYIGQLRAVKVGFGKDPFTGSHPVTPVPEELDYDLWLGPAVHIPYIEYRVHKPNSYSRPGWLRTSDYCCGMITGWGSHHVDSAHWGMDTEHTGPVEIKGWAEYSKDGVWDVHGAFRVEYKYANGVTLSCADNTVHKQGVVFEGTEGWVYVRRGFIDTYPKSLINKVIQPNETHLYKSSNHKRNFIECIRSRKDPVAAVEIGHRSASACILGYIAMLLQCRLHWRPEQENFSNDTTANRLLGRAYRTPWHL